MPSVSSIQGSPTVRKPLAMDLVFVAVIVGFFALSAGLVKLCERL